MPIHWNTSKDVWQDLVQHVAERTVHEAEQRGWTDFYHVSPRANRESIQNMGLMGENGTSPWGDPHERGQPHGNYMFDNSQDAENYAWNLKDREQGSSPYEEMPYEYPDPPEDFHTWPEEQQDEWYDNVEPVERIEDPNGYDVWKVNTRNLPILRCRLVQIVLIHRAHYSKAIEAMIIPRLMINMGVHGSNRWQRTCVLKDRHRDAFTHPRL
jgi:hypothetical protein